LSTQIKAQHQQTMNDKQPAMREDKSSNGAHAQDQTNHKSLRGVIMWLAMEQPISF